LFSNPINTQTTNGQKDDQRPDLQNVQFFGSTTANLIHVNSPGGITSAR